MNKITQKTSLHQLNTNLHFGQFSTANTYPQQHTPYVNSNLDYRCRDLSLSSLRLRSSLYSVYNNRAV